MKCYQVLCRFKSVHNLNNSILVLKLEKSKSVLGKICFRSYTMATEWQSPIHLNNGVKMPIFGLGTYRIPNNNVTLVTECALRHGYRLIDTAAGYRNEEGIGKALNILPELELQREDVFITTKLPPTHHGTALCEEIFNASLSDLGLNYVDLYLIHWPGVAKLQHTDPKLPTLRKETWLKMEELYSNGKMRAIGVSNYTVKHLEELLTYCSVKPAVNQVEYHPYLIQSELHEFCKAHDIHLQAYSSLGTSDGTELLKDDVVNTIAKNLGKSAAQILLKWAIQQEISVIPKASSLDHIKSNTELDFTIPEDDMRLLNNLNQSYHFCWDPETII